MTIVIIDCRFHSISHLFIVCLLVFQVVWNAGDADIYRGNKSIESVVVHEGVVDLRTRVQSRSGREKGAFSSCSNLREAILPESLKTIGYRCFSGCISLTEVSIPSGVDELGKHAFYNCQALKRIILATRSQDSSRPLRIQTIRKLLRHK